MLYDYVQCPHRVALDLFADPGLRDEVSQFVELLWERGHAFEEEVIQGLDIPVENVRALPVQEREEATLNAIAESAPLIYGGRIQAEDLLGEPDILRLQDGGYAAGDIKSGAGLQGEREDSDGKPKRYYACQLALYQDILRKAGIAGTAPPFVWDINGREVVYDLSSPRGPRIRRSMQEEYEVALERMFP